jgi:hypothetical protein
MDSQPRDFRSHDGAAQQFVTVLGDDELAHFGLISGADIYQPHNAAVRLAVDNREFAQILVEANRA